MILDYLTVMFRLNHLIRMEWTNVVQRNLIMIWWKRIATNKNWKRNVALIMIWWKRIQRTKNGKEMWPGLKAGLKAGSNPGPPGLGTQHDRSATENFGLAWSLFLKVSPRYPAAVLWARGGLWLGVGARATFLSWAAQSHSWGAGCGAPAIWNLVS